MKVDSAPFVVTGMHCSGTSFVARLLAQQGVAMGPRAAPAARSDAQHVDADPDFAKLQTDMLAAATAGGVCGWPDWGWTEDERFDTTQLALFAAQAQHLLAARSNGAARWGWHDPRSALLLDFWAEQLPGARFVLVYRHPWAVVDAIQRLGAPIIIEHPEYAWAIWQYYNRRLLDFHRRSPGRSLLVSADRLAAEPEQLSPLLQQHWGIQFESRRTGAVDRRALTTLPSDDPLIPLAAALYPDCVDQSTALDQAASLPNTGLGSVGAGGLKFTQQAKDAPSPDVSIVIPCYNHGEYLVEALVSVERAAPPNCEVLIMDDGSTAPATLRILARLDELGYRVLRQPNQGLSAARNHAIQLARGPIILPLDADNRIRPGFIATALAVFRDRPEVGVVYSAYHAFGVKNLRVDPPDFDLLALLGRNFIDACALLRREVWVQCGGYDETLHALEDWEFWLHAAKHGWQFHRLTPVYFEYRVRADSMLRTFSASEAEQRQHRAYVIAKHFELYQRYFFQVAQERAAYKRSLDRSLSRRILAMLRGISSRLLPAIRQQP